MTTSVKLKGMTWSHPRGLAPLVALTQDFAKQGIDIHWDARSLQGFEEHPIAELAQHYDLIAIDHPFMGTAFFQAALQPVDALLEPSFLRELQLSSVGPSFESYRWQDALWAVPIDAAAQVAATRWDLLSRHTDAIPTQWEAVFQLAERLPAGSVSIPANGTHLLLTFLTLCQAAARMLYGHQEIWPDWWRDEGIDRTVAVAALAMLRRLMANAHPLSWESDPIIMFEHMARHDDILYVPVAFGYSNYARPQQGEYALTFSGVPGVADDIGSGMLGGVGLAVSRQCQHPDAVAQVLRGVANAATQQGIYLTSGGQPAHRDAWLSPHTPQICPNFFDTTLAALDHAFVRPRTAGYPAFQKQGGETLHTLFRTPGVSDEEIIQVLNDLWRQCQQQVQKS